MTKVQESLKELERFEISFLNEDNEITEQLIKDTEEHKIIERELKALEIIIEKQVDIELFNRCKSCKEYNYSVGFSRFNRDLTEEEFNLLKELENVRKN